MTITRLFLKITLFITLLAISTQSYPMFCPTNFNTIELGYTLEQVVRLCGTPDHQSEHQEEVIISNPSKYQSDENYYSQEPVYEFGSNQRYESFNGNSYGPLERDYREQYYENTYSQPYDYQRPKQFRKVKKKIITITRLTYNFPQPAVLIFRDGILKKRVLTPGR